MPEARLPKPPPGFIPFKWKTKPYERDKSITVQICPVCGNFGSVWSGGGYTDPKAQAFFEKVIAGNNGYCGFEQLLRKFEGTFIRDHWSRYGMGKCTACEVEFWHDFIGYPWHYYYNPATAKISHSYTPALF